MKKTRTPNLLGYSVMQPTVSKAWVNISEEESIFVRKVLADRWYPGTIRVYGLYAPSFDKTLGDGSAS